MKIIVHTRYSTPCGEMLLASFEERLCICDWCGGRKIDHLGRLGQALGAECVRGTTGVLTLAVGQLDEYFARSRREFTVPLLQMGSCFQRAVWSELSRIPYGQTISYGIQAQRMGVPRAVRAVANANGANPLSIFVPCHRVVGAGGSLTGYGGGLEAKRMLLDLEISPDSASS